jgi:hypothetical protein
MRPRSRLVGALALVLASALGLLVNGCGGPTQAETVHAAPAAPAAAGGVPPPLRVSVKGRYLIDREDKPFFWLGDTQWVLNARPDQDVLATLDDRAQRGFTVIQVLLTRNWIRSGPEMVRGHERLSADAHGHYPFRDDRLSRPDQAYFDRWEWIVREAGKRGLIVAIHVGEPVRAEAPWPARTPADAYAYGRLIGARFGGHRNVVYNIGHDMHATEGLGVAGWRALAEGVADGVNGVQSFDGRADYATTFMTFHPGGFPPYSSSAWFQGDPWLDANGVQVWSAPERVWQVIAADYARTPAKPVILVEGSYEGGTEYTKRMTARDARQQAWHTYFAGGAGHTYGHNCNWRGCRALDTEGAQAMQHLASWFRRHAWHRFVPDSSIVAGEAGDGATRKLAVRGETADELHVYFPERSPAPIRLAAITAAPTVALSWYDPRTGAEKAGGTLASGETPRLTPPEGWEDAVLTARAVGSDGSRRSGASSR